MDRSRKLVSFGVVVFFLIMGITFSTFAQIKNNEIYSKLETVQQILENQVIPNLDKECPRTSVVGVPATGQTESFTLGDDGDLQMGIPWPNSRFVDNEDGTVTDNLTYLMWTKDAQQIIGAMNWYDAVDACEGLFFADYDDWRLPNAKELLSLIDYSQDMPVLPIDHPFTNVMPGDHYWWCWTSTKQIYHGGYFNVVGLGHGEIGGAGWGFAQWVWAVRGGE